VTVGAYAKELEVAAKLAREAGALILKVYATDFDVTDKGGGLGPLTEADERANAHIVAGLRAAFPGDAVVAEEGGDVRSGATRCWYVDPLDGTAEFVKKNGEFAVHVGLAVNGAAVAGVVYAPVRDVLYSGAEGHPCRFESKGESRELKLTPRTDPKAMRLLVSRSHRSKKTALIQQALGITQVVEHGSVGLKVGQLVEGNADLYLHPSPKSSRWDSCAPEAVIRAAGGELVGFDGQRYRYDGEELTNVRGLVGGASETLKVVLPVVTKIAKETGLVP